MAEMINDAGSSGKKPSIEDEAFDLAIMNINGFDTTLPPTPVQSKALELLNLIMASRDTPPERKSTSSSDSSSDDSSESIHRDRGFYRQEPPTATRNTRAFLGVTTGLLDRHEDQLRYQRILIDSLSCEQVSMINSIKKLKERVNAEIASTRNGQYPEEAAYLEKSAQIKVDRDSEIMEKLDILNRKLDQLNDWDCAVESVKDEADDDSDIDDDSDVGDDSFIDDDDDDDSDDESSQTQQYNNVTYQEDVHDSFGATEDGADDATEEKSGPEQPTSVCWACDADGLASCHHTDMCACGWGCEDNHGCRVHGCKCGWLCADGTGCRWKSTRPHHDNNNLYDEYCGQDQHSDNDPNNYEDEHTQYQHREDDQDDTEAVEEGEAPISDDAGCGWGEGAYAEWICNTPLPDTEQDSVKSDYKVGDYSNGRKIVAVDAMGNYVVKCDSESEEEDDDKSSSDDDEPKSFGGEELGEDGLPKAFREYELKCFTNYDTVFYGGGERGFSCVSNGPWTGLVVDGEHCGKYAFGNTPPTKDMVAQELPWWAPMYPSRWTPEPVYQQDNSEKDEDDTASQASTSPIDYNEDGHYRREFQKQEVEMVELKDQLEGKKDLIVSQAESLAAKEAEIRVLASQLQKARTNLATIASGRESSQSSASSTPSHTPSSSQLSNTFVPNEFIFVSKKGEEEARTEKKKTKGDAKAKIPSYEASYAALKRKREEAERQRATDWW